MARNTGRYRYMRDRANRRIYRNVDYDYRMDSRNSSNQYGNREDYARGRDRYYPEDDYMEYEQSREFNRPYDDMREDYARGSRRINYRNRDYAIGGIGRPREYNYRRDYAEEDMDEEYEEDLKKWIQKLKKSDRFGLSKDQVIQKAREMKVDFKDYDENEFYAIYLMHISDYPSVANEPHTYLAMAKAWLEDKDLEISPSEKVCKYLYEIVMAKEDD